MANFFTASEIVAAAVAIEKRGYAFYAKVAELAEDEEARKFFAFFAVEEMRHEKIFTALLERVGKEQAPIGSDDAEMALYTTSLLDSHAMFSAEATQMMAGKQMDISAALNMAIRFEKDTILFFMAMRDMVPAAEKQHVDVCILEEKKHLKALAQWKQSNKDK